MGLAWTFVVSPLLHSVAHAQGHQHHHHHQDQGPRMPHGAGSPEHLALATLEAEPTPAPPEGPVVCDEPRAPAALPGKAEPPPLEEEPQGP